MAPPQFHIPESTSTVDVHIINSTSRVRGIPTTLMMEPHIDNFDILDCPAFSFLIEHPKTHQKVLFDLGIRKDWENLSARIVKRLKDGGWQVEVEKGVADILKDHQVDPKSINAVIWRYPNPK